MNDQSERIEKHFAKLVAYRDESDKPMTQQGMADKLNSEGVLSLSGKAWSKYSVRRMLNKLNLGADSPAAKPSRSRGSKAAEKTAALSDNEIRARIRKGLYDTDKERFVALPAAAKGSGKKAAKAEKADKKQKKKGKKNKKKK